eukprot:6602349-Pyramimonas_sp.AAC.2
MNTLAQTSAGGRTLCKQVLLEGAVQHLRHQILVLLPKKILRLEKPTSASPRMSVCFPILNCAGPPMRNASTRDARALVCYCGATPHAMHHTYAGMGGVLVTRSAIRIALSLCRSTPVCGQRVRCAEYRWAVGFRKVPKKAWRDRHEQGGKLRFGIQKSLPKARELAGLNTQSASPASSLTSRRAALDSVGVPTVKSTAASSSTHNRTHMERLAAERAHLTAARSRVLGFRQVYSSLRNPFDKLTLGLQYLQRLLIQTTLSGPPAVMHDQGILRKEVFHCSDYFGVKGFSA